MAEPNPELWTIDQAAEHIGAGSAASARRALSRWGVRAAEYRPHPVSGRPQALYRAEEVRTARAGRPGSGNRTPRK